PGRADVVRGPAVFLHPGVFDAGADFRAVDRHPGGPTGGQPTRLAAGSGPGLRDHRGTRRLVGVDQVGDVLPELGQGAAERVRTPHRDGAAHADFFDFLPPSAGATRGRRTVRPVANTAVDPVGNV